MEPIVSPWIFYLCSILHPIKSIFILVGAILIVLKGLIPILNEYDMDSRDSVDREILNLNDIYVYAIKKGKHLTSYLDRIVRVEELGCIDDDAALLTKFQFTMDKLQELDNRHQNIAKKLEKSSIAFTNAKHNIYLGGVLVLIGILIPEESTFYKMIVASYITPDNINLGIEISKDTVEYLIQKIVETSKALSAK